MEDLVRTERSCGDASTMVGNDVNVNTRYVRNNEARGAWFKREGGPVVVVVEDKVDDLSSAWSDVKTNGVERIVPVVMVPTASLRDHGEVEAFLLE